MSEIRKKSEVLQQHLVDDAAFRKGYENWQPALSPHRLITVNLASYSPFGIAKTLGLPCFIRFHMKQSTPILDLLHEIHDRLPADFSYAYTLTTVAKQPRDVRVEDGLLGIWSLLKLDQPTLSLCLNVHGAIEVDRDAVERDDSKTSKRKKLRCATGRCKGGQSCPQMHGRVACQVAPRQRQGEEAGRRVSDATLQPPRYEEAAPTYEEAVTSPMNDQPVAVGLENASSIAALSTGTSSVTL